MSWWWLTDKSHPMERETFLTLAVPLLCHNPPKPHFSLPCFFPNPNSLSLPCFFPNPNPITLSLTIKTKHTSYIIYTVFISKLSILCYSGFSILLSSSFWFIFKVSYFSIIFSFHLLYHTMLWHALHCF